MTPAKRLLIFGILLLLVSCDADTKIATPITLEDLTYSIKGEMLDLEYDVPIADFQLMIKGIDTSYTALSDSIGIFHFDNISEGEYSICQVENNVTDTLGLVSTDSLNWLIKQPYFGELTGFIQLNANNLVNEIITLQDDNVLFYSNKDGIIKEYLRPGSYTFKTSYQHKGYIDREFLVSITKGKTTTLYGTLYSIYSFFPLNTGDIWNYYTYRWDADRPLEVFNELHLQYEVSGDTVFENSEFSYKKVKKYGYTYFYRIDSSEVCVYTYDSQENKENIFLDFQEFTLMEQTVLNKKTKVYMKKNNSYDSYSGLRYALDIGLIEYASSTNHDGYVQTIESASIAGKVYE